jgi:hypothetical protein
MSMALAANGCPHALQCRIELNRQCSMYVGSVHRSAPRQTGIHANVSRAKGAGRRVTRHAFSRRIQFGEDDRCY